MLEKITIKNFKSIAEDTLELGRVNVFIGENGSGKSNILEAFGFASTALVSANIDKEILMGKGVRVAKPSLMVSAFKKLPAGTINFNIINRKFPFNLSISYQDDFIELGNWITAIETTDLNVTPIKSVKYDNIFKKVIEADLKRSDLSEKQLNFIKSEIQKFIIQDFKNNDIENFLIYALNTPALRGFTQQSRKDPVGIYGENLDGLLAGMSKEEIAELTEYQYLIGWLAEFVIDMQDVLKLKGHKLNRSTSKLYFSDKYLKTSDKYFSSENANEGILHVLFYLAVLISKDTPKFFAIDNIESCLNPHLCRTLAQEICTLAKKHDKQVLITTHNPAVLDGLNLHDDEVRLFVVERNKQGHTKTRRVLLKPENGEANGRQLKLSELWMRGYLGGISSNF